ncbi:DUF4276 family protein [Nocardiopsis synnemataformans]|uniref:DUF4276 family protein n=1 Tax=Nocardiopsis synnemataformans TaxID=61305 RepID=UPI003EB9D6A3
MSPVTIAPIVEGHGEHRAVRDLLTRVATEYADTWIDVAQPFRLDSAKMRKSDELTRAVLLQSRRVPDRGGVLVLRDGDDKDITCPVELARSIALDSALARCPVEVVIACPEYEAWFLVAAESLRGHSAMGDWVTKPRFISAWAIRSPAARATPPSRASRPHSTGAVKGDEWSKCGPPASSMASLA